MIKISDQELQTVKDLQKEESNLIFEIGKLEADIFLISEKKKDVQVELKKTFEKLKSMNDSLISKYGIGRLNVETGEYFTEKQ